MTPIAISLVTQIVIAWVAVSLVVALIFGIMAARLQEGRRLRDRRSDDERRSGMVDRRIGLPDTRANPVERRAGPPDRRIERQRRLRRRRAQPA